MIYNMFYIYEEKNLSFIRDINIFMCLVILVNFLDMLEILF